MIGRLRTAVNPEFSFPPSVVPYIASALPSKVFSFGLFVM